MKRTILLMTCGILFVQSNLFAQLQDYSYWSAKATVGANRSQYVDAILSPDGYGFACGIELERTFNPMWGIAAGYTFLDYSIYDQRGSTHEFTGLVNLNFANLVSTYRNEQWQKFNVYGYIGAGFSFYNAGQRNTTIVIPFGVSAEYTLSSRLALSLNGERRWHTSQSMGIQDLHERAALWSATVGLRVKFGSKKHLKNTYLEDYIGDL
jgi:hypothetical protein